MWFWVGQAWGSEPFAQVVMFRAVVPVALGAAILGLYQAFVGLPAYQTPWAIRLYHSTNISATTMRPFGPFVSTAEYTTYLIMAMVLPIAYLFARRPRLSLVFVPVIAGALFLSGVRGPVVTVAGGLAILWGLVSRNVVLGTIQLGLAAVLVIAGLSWTLSQAREAQLDGPAASLVQHQTEGLLNPSESSANTHTALLSSGFASVLHTPLGMGLGSTNRAAGAMGGAGASSELDITDAGIALGAPGALLYLAFVVIALRAAVMNWRRNRMPVSLALGGALVVSFGAWLKGGQYSTAALACFLLGCLDQMTDGTLGSSSKKKATK
jgi:hypothetical protein